MSRRAAPAGIRYSLWGGIPAVYAGRAYPQLSGSDRPTFFEEFVRAFDEVLAPIHAVVEDLDLYLDPRTCPSDFLPWLSSWLGISLNERWPLPRRRRFVAEAASIFRLRGTAEGLRRAVRLYTGAEPEVIEPGVVTVSQIPRPELTPQLSMVVIIVPSEVDGTALEPDLVEQIARLMVPAHIPFEVRLR